MKNNKIHLTVSFMRRTESDIIDKLESVPAKATYIKRLIREDIQREQQQTNK